MEFRVRNRQNRGWFYIDNEFVDIYGKIFGAVGTAIYICLCRHVDKDQKCFPSEKLIGEKLGISDRCVRKYIELLEQYNVIKKNKQRNERNQRWANNIYFLMDRTVWLIPESNSEPKEIITCSKPEENNNSIQRKITTENHRNVVPFKYPNIKEENTIKYTHTENSIKNKIQSISSVSDISESDIINSNNPTSQTEIIFNHWNNKNIINHRKLTKKMKHEINSVLQEYSIEEIKKAIDNYDTVIKDKSGKYFWSFSGWDLVSFLDKGLSRFVEENKPLERFINNKKISLVTDEQNLEYDIRKRDSKTTPF